MKPQTATIIETVSNKLPDSSHPKYKEKMDHYWTEFDRNKSGYLNSAEVERGIRLVMKLPDVFPLERMLKKAFKATKSKIVAMTKYGDDRVSKAEFHYLVQYIKNFYIYWAIFNNLDDDHDKKLSLPEFNQAKHIFEANKIPIPDVKELFNSIDKRQGGFIEFYDFCDWVLTNRHTFQVWMINIDFFLHTFQ